MKNFDKAAAMRGAKVCTRTGTDVLILCFNSRASNGWGDVPTPIIAEVNSKEESVVNAYQENGMLDYYGRETGYDLMMADDDYLEKLERGEYPSVGWDTSVSDQSLSQSNTSTDPWDEFKRKAALSMIQSSGANMSLLSAEIIIDCVNRIVEGLRGKQYDKL